MQSEIKHDKYEEVLKTFSIHKASILAIRVLGVLVIVLGIPFIFLHINKFSTYFSNFNMLSFLKDGALFLLFIIIGIVLHELIHGLTWVLFVKERFRAIRFGIMWEYLTPYCHCNVPLRLKHYIVGALMPAIILGVVPTIYAFFSGNIILFWLGIYFTVAASGDFLITYLLKDENSNSYVVDHDSLPGCTVYRLKSDL